MTIGASLRWCWWRWWPQRWPQLLPAGAVPAAAMPPRIQPRTPEHCASPVPRAAPAADTVASMAGSNTDDRPQRADEVPVRPAATVMLVRDAHPGVEVFMMKPTLSASFASGQYVFPGGRVDDADHADELEAICDGIDDAEASARLGLKRGGIGWIVAAIRECFEEAGVLLARRADEDSFVRFEGDLATAMATARHQVHAGKRSLADVCAEFDLRLVTDPI